MLPAENTMQPLRPAVLCRFLTPDLRLSLNALTLKTLIFYKNYKISQTATLRVLKPIKLQLYGIESPYSPNKLLLLIFNESILNYDAFFVQMSSLYFHSG